jgi:hypothetical protein
MNFYSPNKTFLELIEGYEGDIDEAYGLFEDGWSEGNDSRTVAQAFGCPVEEYIRFMDEEITIPELLQKYRPAAAASVSSHP